MRVTRLGYGSMGLRGPRTWGIRCVSDADAEAFLHAVLDAGINFIDTAPDYGVSEQRIGDFIGSRRDEYYLATKCGCDYVQHQDHLEIRHTWTREVILRNLETSLRRLRTDRIDLMQFHGGDAHSLQQTGLIELLRELREQGVIRYIGVSSKLPELPELVNLGVFDTFQIPYSCLAPEHEAWISQAAQAGAGIIVRGGVAQGGPAAEIQRPNLNDVWNRAALAELVPLGCTPAQFILRNTLAHPQVDTVIVGTCNLQHLQENLSAVQQPALPTELVTQVKQRVASI